MTKTVLPVATSTSVMGYFSMDAISKGVTSITKNLPDVSTYVTPVKKFFEGQLAKLPTSKDLEKKWKQIQSMKIGDVVKDVSKTVQSGYEFVQNNPGKTALGCSAVAVALLGISYLRSRKEPSSEQKLAAKLIKG